MTRELTADEKAQDVWEAALREAWLRDHPGKTLNDYELAGSCGDTDQAQWAFLKWFATARRIAGQVD